MDLSAVNSFQYLGRTEQSSFQRLSSRLQREQELPTQEHEKLYEACQEFEALFIKQMLNAMRKTVTKTKLIDGGMAEEIFEDMLYDEYAKKMAKTAGFGLADMLYRDLSPRVGQEEGSSAAAAAAYRYALGT